MFVNEESCKKKGGERMNGKWIDEALEKTLMKVKENIDAIGLRYPHVSINGTYDNQGPGFWTSGFWPGILWLYYFATKDEKAKELAIGLENGMDAVLDGFLTLHHDVGFMWIPSSVAHYSYDGDSSARLRALKAASHLAGRFNPAGNFLRAWNDDVRAGSQGLAIIDCMMNLSLLYWAGKEIGDPRFKNIAIAHTDMVLTAFRREDGSYPHVVSFNPVTGEKLGNIGGQGYGPDSAWARGQSWAIYGMTIGYRETGDIRYLAAAKEAAGFFLPNLPEKKVPVWDFRAPVDHRDAEDSSAAACAASALIGLSSLAGNERDRMFYLAEGMDILEKLYFDYSDYSVHEQAVIKHGTVNYPAGRNIDVPIIYADFFFLEALLKLKGMKGLF